MMVQSGERVDITPTHKVGDNVKALSSIQKAIENLNQNMAANSGGEGGTANLVLDGEIIAESVFKKLNRHNLNNRDTTDF